MLGRVIVLSPPDASAAVNIISSVSALDPSKVIFPPAIDIAFAASATPETRVVAVKVVEVRADKPAIVVAVAPKLIEVLPTVKDEFANWEFGIADVPISPPEKVNPEPDATLICALTSDAEGPVYVITPVELLYERLPSPPESVTDTAALDLASV